MSWLPPAIIDGLELAVLARKNAPGKCFFSVKDAGLPWWWFATPYFDRDAFITWRHPQWWWQKHERVRGRINLFFARLGVWDIGMAGYFDRGRWRLDFWRSPRSWWRLHRTGLEIANESLRRRVEEQYRLGLADGEERYRQRLEAQFAQLTQMRQEIREIREEIPK